MSRHILFLVPARGGSRRVPGKNLRLVGGIPLVGWAARIAAAAAADLAADGLTARVVCSTDDDALAATAAAWGAEVLRRPAELATDEATSAAVAVHALDAEADAGNAADVLVLLQPTSPLTDPRDVAAAVRRHLATGRAVTSVVRDHPAAWHLALGPEDELAAAPAPTAPSSAAAPDSAPDAEAAPAVGPDALLAGAFYVVAPDALRATGRFVTPGETLGQVVAPDRAVDVDEPHHLVTAEALLAARPVRPVPVGPHVIGGGRVIVIAEAGVNHDGDVAVAHQLVDAAADAGADIVKFQTFEARALATAGAPTAAYQQDAVGASDQRSMLEALALPADAWAALQAHARERGIGFLSTPFDDGSATLLDVLDVPAFKVGSGELTNTPFIARLARLGRPLLLSTGMADMVEVAAAVDAVRANGDPPFALFHCVSSYPAAPRDANLRAIETLRRAFGVPVGWSDHTPGIEMPIAAVAAGATIVEKHLTLDRGRTGPDHAASLEPASFAAMVAAVRAVEAALGTGVKAPVDAERDVAAVARRSVFWARSLAAGEVVGDDAIAILRPGTGMRPAAVTRLLGGRTVRPVAAGDPVRPDDVERRP